MTTSEQPPRRSHAGWATTPEGVTFRRAEGVLPFKTWHDDSRVYLVMRGGFILGYAERRDRVPVFDGATPGNPSGWHKETQWVAYLTNGQGTDESHSNRVGVALELIRRMGNDDR